MSIPGLFFDMNASSRELESIEQSYNETLKRYGITDNENNSKPLHPDSNGNHSRDDVLGVPVEEQVLHKRAGERTEKAEGR